MPRIVSAAERQRAINLMYDGMGQRDIQKETGLSRPYLRKIAREIGFQFPRNGVEVIGRTCMCTNCGLLFRKPPSKVERAKLQFCDDLCRKAWMKGPNHPSWKTGKTAATFSSWIKNQSGYDKWREAVLERDGHKCQISGRDYNLHIHHILPKAESISPETALDVDNGMTLNEEVHDRIHELIRDGKDFEEAIEAARQEFNAQKV
jgi:5-methylcytosine-specific restriction endonuclease McrA